MASVPGGTFLFGLSGACFLLVGSEGVAAVIDPQRDVDIYLDAAGQKDLKIEHIIETHLHADFVSGHHELAERTGARIYLGDGSPTTRPAIRPLFRSRFITWESGSRIRLMQ